MAKKIVGLDNLKVVKSYIDKVRGEISGDLDLSTKKYLDDQLTKASEAIENDYKSKYKDLENQIAWAEQNNKELADQLKMELDSLVHDTNDKFDALDALEREIEVANGKYDNLYEGITTNAIFSPGQFNDIIRTALIDETLITDDMVSTPNVFTSKIVALVGNFGQVKAANIIGGTIEGSSIQSSARSTDRPDDPVWKIDDDGSGWLANRKIEWFANGDIRLDPSVEIKWASLVDGNEVVDTKINVNNEKIEDYINTSLNGKANLKDLEEARKNAEKATEDLKILMAGDGSEENKGLIQQKIDIVQEYVDEEFKHAQADNADKRNQLQQALEQAILNGDTKTAEEIQGKLDDIAYEMQLIDQEAHEIAGALEGVKTSFNTFAESALTKYNMQEIISASLINKTQWDDQHVETPLLLAKKIVAVIATFGTVKANRIMGDEISGVTVSSPTWIKDPKTGEYEWEYTGEYAKDENGNPIEAVDDNGVPILKYNPETEEWENVYILATEIGPDGKIRPETRYKRRKSEDITWQLNSDGSGWLAEHQIKWDYPRKEDGTIDYPEDKELLDKYPEVELLEDAQREWRKDNVNVKFGDGVTIEWESVKGAQKALDKRVEESSNDMMDKINGWGDDTLLSMSEQRDLITLYNNITKEYEKLINLYNTYTGESYEITINGKDEYDKAYENLESAVKHHTSGIWNWDAKEAVPQDSKYTVNINRTDVNDATSDLLDEKDSKRYERISDYYPAKENFSNILNKAIADNSAEIAKNAALDEANKNIKSAKDSIGTDLETAKNELNTAIATGNAAAIAAAEGALAKAEAAQSGLDSLETAVNNIGKDGSTILSAGDIHNLSIAAIQNKTTITGDTVSSENILAKNIIGLAGTFAEVQAEKIKGTEIKGKTLSSMYDDDPTTTWPKTPTWQLNQDGSGYLANKKIQFTTTEPYMTIDGEAVLTSLTTGSTAQNFKDLVADYAQIGKLDVYELNTGLRPDGGGEEGNGRINIKENTISVYEAGKTDEILLVTGETGVTIPQGVRGSSNVSKVTLDSGSTSNGSYNFPPKYAANSIGSFVKGSKNFSKYTSNYKLGGSGSTVTVSIARNNGNSISGNANVFVGIVISTSVIDADWLYTNVYNKGNLKTSLISYGTASTNSGTISANIYLNNNNNISKLDNFDSLSDGTEYHVYFCYYIGALISGVSSGQSYSSPEISLSLPDDGIVYITPKIKKTIIAGNGLYYIAAHDKYLKMTDKEFEVRFVGNYLKIDENGVVKDGSGW